MDYNNNIPNEDKNLLDAHEAAKYLKISIRTLHKLLSEKKIKAYRLTKKLLFLKADLLDDVKRCKPNTTLKSKSNA